MATRAVGQNFKTKPSRLHIYNFRHSSVTIDLNLLKSTVILKLSGIEFHGTGAAYRNEFLSCMEALTCWICNILEYQKLYLPPLLMNNSESMGGTSPSEILKVSKAVVLILRVSNSM